MKPATPGPEKNGIVAVSNGTAAKMACKRAAKTVPPYHDMEPFATADVEPVDAPMLPVHAVVWLQPALQPALPRSSGLRIERHLHIPAPDFLPVDPAPACHPHQLETSNQPI